MTRRSLRATAVATPALVLMALLPAAPSAEAALVAGAPTRGEHAGVRLDVAEPVGGRAALRAIEGREVAVAELNGLSVARLTALLRNDATTHLTGTGRLFHRDEIHSAPDAAAVPRVAPFPNAQTFQLHSKPGSQRTIYLDFNGVSVSGTAWNDPEFGGLPNGTYEGFSLDGTTGSFNDAEQSTIQQVWQSVAEDYAPFDVDVTTEAPPAGAIDRTNAQDQVYGTVAAVSGSKAAHAALCGSEGCTGVAFIDVFDAPGAQHGELQPAWTFSAYYDDVTSLAETISHEVGHNFGLNHDGDAQVDYYGGHNGWAPIMGSSLVPITQWSKGDYAGADNQQDDLAVIAGSGAPVRADDAGGTAATASAFPAGSGVIASRNDVDVYLVGTCTGPLTVTGATAYAMPDLDMKLTLLDGAGTELASANPVSKQESPTLASGMGASVTYTATGAPVYVAVDGVGRGTPSTGYDDYGSLGSYELSRSGSCDGEPVVVAPGAVQGLTASGTTSDVTVTWSAPASDGGAPVEEYEVSLDGDVLGTVTTPGAVIEGDFAPGATYAVAVRAANSAGFGPSVETTFTVPVVLTVPGAPTTLTAKPGRAGGQRTVVFGWKAPAATGGSPLTRYTVYVYRMRNGRTSLVGSLNATPTQRRMEVRIDPGTYKFRVKARNAQGLSAFSAYSSAATAR